MSNTRKAAIAVIGLAGAAIGWYLISPLFLNTVVDEAFPPLATVTDSTTTTVGPTTSVPEAQTTSPTTPPTTAAPAEPELVLMGSFMDADDNHKGEGTASIYEINGRNVLRFEDFDVTNGPDLHVYLVEDATATSLSGFGEYTDLGELKGNQGNQNYDLPSTFDPAITGGVVIWCEPFQVLFAVAALGS